MSNTATVTPIASASSGDVGELAVGAATIAAAAVLLTGVAAVAVIGYLCHKTDAEKAALARDRRQRDRHLLDASARQGSALLAAGRQAPGVASVPLHLTDPMPLVAAARQLGYQPVPSSTPDVWLLGNDRGERLAVSKQQGGTLQIHAAAQSRRLVDAVMRQYTLDRVVTHFQARNMDVQMVRRGQGEVEIQARETAVAVPGDQARVTARVNREGEVLLDVDKCVGKRCQDIVDGVAKAVSGRVSSRAFKDAYYQEGRQRVSTRVRG